ncbi:CheY chemotaxis protein or a CheY-like REC (receiver) domain [Loktanella sp. DSM 29012]|uniref:Response regulator n=1 Tax=Loktanella gaetbuli TaxID=2881335 RepID=A0ABS8BT73_9RHOB|nr:MULTISPECIES: response regulator [Loktanella]KQI70274.1 two-component response regulator [Loktanella sp. 3ANDIMAR09]MCB5198933.1 response regulator [Loktanella gaetbuli]SEP69122.1 CheY chemotaxis protein or a CheY-like REC (receiver) domain [Loktanella sp. DSM 29012]
MASASANQDITTAIGTYLPYLRRYARALTGSQSSGDAYAAATLEAILEDRSIFDMQISAKSALFKTLHMMWSSTDLSGPGESPVGIEGAALRHLAKLTTNTREALLLNTIEEFSFAEIADIMSIDEAEAEHLVSVAHREMADSIAGRILIIEDEAIIAMDLEALVSDMGHKVTGIARTHEGAVKLGTSEKPDLILADIQLADNSSGIDAVNELLQTFGDMPVIFITAFPERLLTGDKPEPAFLIAKPYTEEQVRSAVAQAMFFSSTETLNAG